MLCGTRAIKNVKKIKSLVPDAFPAVEPLEGHFSIYPFDVLNRFHRLSEPDLTKYPKLAEASRLLSKKPAGAVAPHGIIFSDPPFKGTLHFAQLTFQAGQTSVSVSDADMAMLLQYMQVAHPAIAEYCAQYGDNSLAVSPKILKMTVQTSQGKYNDDTLQGWIRSLFTTIDTPVDKSCIVVFNPNGIVNTDGALSSGILGYHNEVILPIGPPGFQSFIGAPFCFVNVTGQGLTVDDRRNLYADTLSHEVSEMVVDPFASHTNPEVCDACAGNCNKNWHGFFSTAGGGFTYLRSASGIPPAPFKYDFFTAAVAQPPYPDKCPSPDWGCNYAPSARPGVGNLLFYERPSGYAELYSVDARANIAIQTIYPDWRTTWTDIVPAHFTAKPAGSRNDLLFYSESEGHGEFYQTGLVGDMHQFSVHNNWRNSWSIIVPGSFSAPNAMDLLFYEPSDGFGEFDHTDGNGNLTLIKGQSGWRTGWRIIVPGHFSNGLYTDLLFYSPSEATGEFYKSDGGGNIALIQTHTNWRNTWTIIIPAHFSNSPFTDLLFYSPSEGTGEFYSTDGRGNLTLIQGHTNWRKTWTMIIPGHFSNSAYTDLLFYSPSEGTGEFWSTDGRGNMTLIQSHTNWRTTWSLIRSL